MPYNPFDKYVDQQLDAADLQLLIDRNVSEGYYIEFKSEMPSSAKIAKSIAALANTYGGWFIVGVETDPHNVANSVTGFEINACLDPIATVRDVARHHIDPVPVFFVRVVHLPSNRLVVVVHVPDGQETPFITRDGRLYRRTHDASEPVYENNRHALDQIVQRGRKVASRFRRFAEDKRTMSRSESDQGWLKLYFSPHPVDTEAQIDVTSTSAISELLEESSKPLPIAFPKIAGSHDDVNFTGNTPFNSSVISPESVVLRQIKKNQEAFNSLSLELDAFGRAKMFVPLPKLAIMSDDLAKFDSVSVRKLLLGGMLVEHSSAYLLQYFDIGQTWLTVTTLLHFYLWWLRRWNVQPDFRFALHLDEVWRHVAVCDDDLWTEHSERFGVPAIMQNDVRFPLERNSTLVRNDPFLWMYVCGLVGSACGLPCDVFAGALGTILFKAARGRSNSDVEEN